MRVCYLCADRGIPLDGHKGAAAHVRGFVRALQAEGHEVRVLTGAPCDAPPADLPATFIEAPRIAVEIGGRVSPRMARALGHLWTNAAVERTLARTIEEFAPDLIYERYSPFSAAGTLLARAAGVPHVLEVNAPLAWEGSRFRKQALADAAEELERAVFATAPLIVAVSDELRSWLLRAGVDAARLAVLPNGVDASVFTPAGPRHRCADGDAIVLGFVGSLKEWHGLEVLAEAFRTLAADPRFHLLVVGDGPMAPLVRALADEHPGRVTWTGALDHAQVPEHVRGMDIAVAPYPDTGEFYFSPLKVLEYMAAGVPVVVSAIGQLRSLVVHGRTGILVPPGDARRLADAARALAADGARRREMGAAAAADVAARHTWQQRVRTVLGWTHPDSVPVAEAACSR